MRREGGGGEKKKLTPEKFAAGRVTRAIRFPPLTRCEGVETKTQPTHIHMYTHAGASHVGIENSNFAIARKTDVSQIRFFRRLYICVCVCDGPLTDL